MSCVCDVTDGAREFPDNLVCVITDGFTGTAPRKKKYLGNKASLVDKATVSITILVRDETEAAIFLEWWVSELDYGVNPFTINVPFFGISRGWNVLAIGDMTDYLKIGTVREVKMKLRILNDLSEAISNNECEVCK